ncbi:heat shock 70 kDa protein 12A-like [Mya arenaria]|uniref:heat shock 70 kDa protein 12A-like n=1 Tax=Mya arenaria TaxID=6604 RepID=UPI0022E493E4|nr:heat shock 70 kDa protein 12A-like [Mya arenaria]
MGAGASAKPNKETKKEASSTSPESISGRNGVNEPRELQVVVAIDFGTSYSGYAFSFKGSQNEIKTQRLGGKLSKDRVPTVLLLNPDQTFNSFGYYAMETYSSLPEEERQKYFYFERFKMFLYEKLRGETRVKRATLELRAAYDLELRDLGELYQLRVNQLPEYLRKHANSKEAQTTLSPLLRIKDISEKELDARTIFSLAIKYFKDIAVETVDLSTLGLKEEYIQWMITIPAIWSDYAKQFMRQAAKDAGIRPENLRLVLEPEAASLYCEEDAIVASGNTLDSLPVGHKYILADLGGGTVDICVHEVMDEGKLRELYRVTGGDFGGNTVDKEFEIFMSKIVGLEVWNEFKKKYFAYYHDFMGSFETKKRDFRMDTATINFRLEPALISLCETRSNETFTSIVARCKHSTSVEYKPMVGKLFLNRSEMERFFDHSLRKIIESLSDISQACKTDNIATLLLVGGYAESHYVREIIKSSFPLLRVMCSSDSSLAVLKGAVMMGYKPRDIVERRARFTYGFGCHKAFIPGKDPNMLRFIDDGVMACGAVFEKMIEKNQVVKYGDTFTYVGYFTASDPYDKHKVKHISLWRSSVPNTRYCLEKEGSEILGIEDQACEEVAMIYMKPPTEGWPIFSNTDTHIIIGETELTLKDVNKTTGQMYETSLNFF